jgi:hypothetical protein
MVVEGVRKNELINLRRRSVSAGPKFLPVFTPRAVERPNAHAKRAAAPGPAGPPFFADSGSRRCDKKAPARLDATIGKAKGGPRRSGILSRIGSRAGWPAISEFETGASWTASAHPARRSNPAGASLLAGNRTVPFFQTIPAHPASGTAENPRTRREKLIRKRPNLRSHD